jgi:mannosyl-oligosaccharide alpha-1,2-mannosidase
MIFTDKLQNIEVLLSQARALADIMSYSFLQSPTGIPHNELYFPGPQDAEKVYSTDRSDDNGLATLGTLILEWTRLSDQTGNRTYFDLASKAQSYLLNPQPPSQEPFPGLISSVMSISTGQLRGGSVSWSGGADSFYEYLIKMFVYDPERFKIYKDRWILAADSSIKHLAYTAVPSGATFLTEYDGNNGRQVLKSGHLTCFDGGNFILGGIVLDRQDYIDFGIKLVHGCWKTYEISATGIGPERWSFDPKNVPTTQRQLFESGGFYTNGPGDPEWSATYSLRPEVIESIYYAYRATGDPMYQDWAWKAFESIQRYCKTDRGYVGLVDTNNATSPFRQDMQESFFFAETLKYLYIIQAGVSFSLITIDYIESMMLMVL